MSARFLLCTFALGVGAVTACSGATNTGLFAPGDDTSTSTGMDSGGGSTPDSSSGGQDTGTTTTPDTGTMEQPDASMPVDASPPVDATPPPVDSAPPDPGVQCADAPGTHCSVPTESCCIEGLGTSTQTVATCTQSGGCFQGVEVPCDNAAECDEIDPGQGEICCGTVDQTAVVTSVECSAPADCDTTADGVILCDPNDATACPTGTTCKASTRTLPGYYLCLQ